MTSSPPSPDASGHDVEALIEAHLPLTRYAVNAIVGRLQPPEHVSRDDLLSAARMALVEAARRYDPTTGATFATYARTRLHGAVVDELRAVDWASRSVRADARRLDAATSALTHELGHTPSREQVADRLGVPTRAVANLEHDIDRARIDSLDAKEIDRHAVADLLASHECPEHTVVDKERLGYLHDALAHLPDRLGEVIERNFFGEETLTDIAADMGLTLARVSQMRAHGLRLLHAALSELVDGTPVPATGGSRARSQQQRFVQQVATASGDYRTRLAPRPERARHSLEKKFSVSA